MAATFPNMYGAGANNLAGKTNTQVAAIYKTLFARTAAGGGPAKMDAQVLATAFAVYLTNQNWRARRRLPTAFRSPRMASARTRST
jgi:hypothetical protein